MQNDQFVYIQVADEDDPKEAIEMPSEDDGTLLLTTIQAQFPGATGLRYKNELSGCWRALRVSQGVLCPPPEGWHDCLFFVVRPRTAADTSTKRKIDASPGQKEPEAKQVKIRDNGGEHIGDLIVLGLPFKADEKEMRSYFGQYGELSFVQVKKDPMTGESRGFGFVSFADNKAAETVLSRTHLILGRRCEVRLPRPKDDPHIPYKLFIGRLAGGTTTDDLKNYFEMFGELTDVYIPKPFRGFGFITFASSESVKRVMGSNHTINGAQVYLTFAAPKSHRDDDIGYHSSMSQMGQRSGMSPYSFSTPTKPPSSRLSGRSSAAYSWHSGEHGSSPRS
eukprot:Seg782.4 transcript_id=Seg782.4/GoldUCD/mRNA.D3Y31 product="TAR DNA-binding protein 43" protein_id=Seg782.4/GoldUCD/D3Y31